MSSYYYFSVSLSIRLFLFCRSHEDVLFPMYASLWSPPDYPTRCCSNVIFVHTSLASTSVYDAVALLSLKPNLAVTRSTGWFRALLDTLIFMGVFISYCGSRAVRESGAGDAVPQFELCSCNTVVFFPPPGILLFLLKARQQLVVSRGCHSSRSRPYFNFLTASSSLCSRRTHQLPQRSRLKLSCSIRGQPSSGGL